MIPSDETGKMWTHSISAEDISPSFVWRN